MDPRRTMPVPMRGKVAGSLCLDSAGSDGLATEVSQVVSLQGLNTVQVQIVVFALTANNVGVQVQVSNDGVNWANQGSAQTMTGFGRKIFTAESAIGAAHVRLLFTLDGAGKAIVSAWVAVSRQ